ncbi:hypothetical protein AMR72_15320 [Flavobacterium psychrophilum]|nr:hypothetical protein AMR72_15320 [Flavobacterium psychrophilum]AOE53762.1 hypothetical protein ALW18_15310 [Flavobacterium psychrophilum]
MKLYDFLALDDNNQYQAVWEQGKHVDDIIVDNIHYQLYSINDFFVEIEYCQLSNKILGKNQFKHGHELDKYLFR